MDILCFNQQFSVLGMYSESMSCIFHVNGTQRVCWRDSGEGGRKR